MRLNRLILVHKTLKPFQGVFTCCIHSTYFNTSRRNYATEDLVLSNNKLVFNKSIDKPTIARTVGSLSISLSIIVLI